MKLLHREDVMEAGYDLPKEGLCANIGDAEMQQLRFGGEWILAEDETLVADGHEQRFLYLVVSGEVAITKINDQASHNKLRLSEVVRHLEKWLFLAAGLPQPMFNQSGSVFFGERITSNSLALMVNTVLLEVSCV